MAIALAAADDFLGPAVHHLNMDHFILVHGRTAMVDIKFPGSWEWIKYAVICYALHVTHSKFIEMQKKE